jgi:ABC-type multidrug transport system fused ATPase/permease subunit
MRAQYTSFIKMDAGDLINRFSADMSLIDGGLGMSFIYSANSKYNNYMVILNLTSVEDMLLAVAACIILIATTPYIAAAMPIVMTVFWGIQTVYLPTSKQLRIIDLDAKAPICSHFISSLSGRLAINSFGWRQVYEDKNEHLLEDSQKAYYLLKTVQNWISLVLDMTVAVLAIILTALAVSLKQKVDPAFLGLAMTSIVS